MTVYFADGTSLASGDVGGGLVLQVQSVKGPSSQVNASGSTWQDVLSLNITPTATSSRVKVEVCGEPVIGGYHTQGVAIRVLRGSTVIYPDHTNSNLSGDNAIYSSIADNGDNYNTMNGVCVVDSPSTTSATTYKYQLRRTQGNNNNRARPGTMALTLTELGPNP